MKGEGNRGVCECVETALDSPASVHTATHTGERKMVASEIETASSQLLSERERWLRGKERGELRREGWKPITKILLLLRAPQKNETTDGSSSSIV